MDSPQNNIDSVFGNNNSFTDAVSLHDVVAGNKSINQYLQVITHNSSNSYEQHFGRTIIIPILFGVGLCCFFLGLIAICLFAILFRMLFNPSHTSLLMVLSLGMILWIIIALIGAVYLRKKYLPAKHNNPENPYRIRKQRIKIVFLPINIYVWYELEGTREYSRIFCFLGIPFLRKTATGYYLIGFIPLTFMLGILLGMFVISGMIMYKQSIQPTSQQRANERNISPIPIIPIPTPTVDVTELKRVEYALGQEAYSSQDWPLAAQAFNRVWEIDPSYLDLKNIGSATYFNWALSSLTSPQSVKTSQQYLAEALRFNPKHHLATRLSAALTTYQTGEQALRDGNYTVAIEQLNQTLEQFHADQEFNALVSSLSVSEKIYQAYLLDAGTALEIGDLEAARQAYRQAILLKDQDTNLDVSEAQSELDAISSSISYRLYFQKYAENAVDPTCFAVHIRWRNTTGWFVMVDGLGNRGNVDGAGNTNVCGLIASQEVTFTVYDASGEAVLGGSGIPTRGGDLMRGYWQ